jgi:peroxiredoxin
MPLVLVIRFWRRLWSSRPAPHLKPGDLAPDFALPDHNGALIRLTDFRGRQTVVLAFFTKTFTPG